MKALRLTHVLPGNPGRSFKGRLPPAFFFYSDSGAQVKRATRCGGRVETNRRIGIMRLWARPLPISAEIDARLVAHRQRDNAVDLAAHSARGDDPRAMPPLVRSGSDRGRQHDDDARSQPG